MTGILCQDSTHYTPRMADQVLAYTINFKLLAST